MAEILPLFIDGVLRTRWPASQLAFYRRTRSMTSLSLLVHGLSTQRSVYHWLTNSTRLRNKLAHTFSRLYFGVKFVKSGQAGEAPPPPPAESGQCSQPLPFEHYSVLNLEFLFHGFMLKCASIRINLIICTSYPDFEDRPLLKLVIVNSEYFGKWGCFLPKWGWFYIFQSYFSCTYFGLKYIRFSLKFWTKSTL